MSILVKCIYMNNSDKTTRELIALLKSAEGNMKELTLKIEALRDSYEFPYLIRRIKEDVVGGKVKKVDSNWIQRKFKIGYARAMRLTDELKRQRIIKRI